MDRSSPACATLGYRCAASALEGYERWASSYEQLDNPLVAATAWVLDHAPLEVAGRDVIELGCGTERHAARVSELGARSYTGVDGSPAMLAVGSAATPARADGTGRDGTGWGGAGRGW